MSELITKQLIDSETIKEQSVKYAESAANITKGSGEGSVQQITTAASGEYSHAEGSYTKASGNCSHAEGGGVIDSSSVSGEWQFNSEYGISEFGYANTTKDSEGNIRSDEYFETNLNFTSNSINFEKILVTAFEKGVGCCLWYYNDEQGYVDVAGFERFDEPYRTIIINEPPTSFKDNARLLNWLNVNATCKSKGTSPTVASGAYSHAEGQVTHATAQCSHAEGSHTEASGYYAHTEGERTIANGIAAHAEGYKTTASGHSSHAEGGYTIVSGQYAHAEGCAATLSTSDFVGTWEFNGVLEHVGKVTACTLDFNFISDGVLYTKLDVSVEGSSASRYRYKLTYSNAKQSITPYSMHTWDINLPACREIYIFQDIDATSAFAQWLSTHAKRIDTNLYTAAFSNSAHAEGQGSIVYGTAAHAEGIRTFASGDAAHAEGYTSQATGNYSHSEGGNTLASGHYAHTEGLDAKAAGKAAHAEGFSTSAQETTAHAEGYASQATAKAAHAEGSYTIASAENQHVQGKYNVEDPDSVHIVGWGSSKTKRKNIHTISKTGDGWFLGNVLVGENKTPVATKADITTDNLVSGVETMILYCGSSTELVEE